MKWNNCDMGFAFFIPFKVWRKTMFFLLGWIYSGGLKGKPCPRGGGPESGGWRRGSQHMCSHLSRGGARCEGGKYQGWKDSRGSNYFSICLRRKEREEIKEGRKIISLCGDQMQPGVLSQWRLYFPEKLTLGRPEPPLQRAVTVELETSGSTRTEVARVSTTVISHVTSWLPSFLAPPGWIGSRGKRKRKTIKLNLYYIVGILYACPLHNKSAK